LEGFAMSEDILSEAHLKAIGALVVQTSKIESILTDMIGAFAGMDIVAALITVHHQQASSKTDSLLAFCKLYLSAPEFQPIHDLFTSAKAIADFRNTVVHAFWALNEHGEATAVRFSARGEFQRSRRPISAAQIQARSDEAGELILKLVALRDRMRTLPSIHPEPESE
jgi:hypothetical protein